MSFSDIRDQEVAVRLLQQILRSGRIPNAMLFLGPGGVGKALAALEMAKAVNCTERPDDACDQCLQCRKVDHGNHPDVRIVVPKGTSRSIRTNVISEINEICSLRPYESEWRTVVIQDADRMNATAQNHFLKMLEEPPGQTLFILLSEYPRELLPTIRSRCQAVRFRTLRRETVSALLQRERDLTPEKADSIAGLSQGRMDRALEFLDSDKRDIALYIVAKLKEGMDPVELSEEFAKRLATQRKEIEAAIDAELNIDPDETLGAEEKQAQKELRLAHTAAAVRRGILDYLYLLETWYRDEMVYAATHEEGKILNQDHLDGFRDHLSTAPEKKIQAVEKARYYLDRFVNEERVFRDLFFALAAE
ncbi:MAG: DNA polymerase III subunit delta' [Candidatus Hydrogenedentota bacterium]